MSFEKSMKELEETGIMDRAMALGPEADAELTALEELENPTPKKHERIVKRLCLYCGEHSEAFDFVYSHVCPEPMIIETKKWPCPSRPIAVRFFKITYNSKTYKFIDYHSAMRFRKLIWINDVPLCKALEDKYLRWYK